MGVVRVVPVNLVVVGFDDFCHVWHATVANFDGVSVEDLVQFASFREMLVNQLQEFLAYICCYIFAEGGVEPNDIAFSVTVVSVAGSTFDEFQIWFKARQTEWSLWQKISLS